VFSSLEVFSEVCGAVAARVSLDCKLAPFPSFPGSSELFLAVRTLGHSSSLFLVGPSTNLRALRAR
jgi:hypothetical protein